jgi:hypothetical protein
LSDAITLAEPRILGDNSRTPSPHGNAGSLDPEFGCLRCSRRTDLAASRTRYLDHVLESTADAIDERHVVVATYSTPVSDAMSVGPRWVLPLVLPNRHARPRCHHRCRHAAPLVPELDRVVRGWMTDRRANW